MSRFYQAVMFIYDQRQRLPENSSPLTHSCHAAYPQQALFPTE